MANIKRLVEYSRTEPARIFLISLLAITLSTADQSLFSYAIPGMLEEFDINLKIIGYILSASFFVASFAVVFIGMLSDYIGRRRVLVSLLGLSALFVGLHAFADSLLVLTILRISGFALGAGLYLVASTMVVETAPQQYRGLIAGTLQIGYPLGFAIASLIVVPLIDAYGWRSIFLPAFVVLLVSPLIAYLLPESSRFKNVKEQSVGDENGKGLSDSLFELLEEHKTNLFICFAGSFFISFAIGGTTYFLPTFLVSHYGMTLSQAGSIVGSSYAIGAVGYILSSAVGDFVLSRRNTLIIWILFGSLFFLYAIWEAQLGIILTLSLGMTILFLYGSEAVRMPMIGELFPTHLRATATGVSGSLAVTTAWLLAPLLISWGSESIGWPLTLTYFGIIPLFVSSVVFLFLPNKHSNTQIY